MRFIPVLYIFSGLALSCIRFATVITRYYLTARLVLPGRVERSYDFREENCALSLAKCKPTYRLERNIDTALAGECEEENGAHRKSHGGKEVTPLHLSFPIFHFHTVFLRLYPTTDVCSASSRQYDASSSLQCLLMPLHNCEL